MLNVDTGAGTGPISRGRFDRVMSIGIDEDQLNFRSDGLIGFQRHSGPPMRSS